MLLHLNINARQINIQDEQKRYIGEMKELAAGELDENVCERNPFTHV